MDPKVMTKQEMNEDIDNRKVMVLTVDVVNPDLDRRAKHDWRKLPIWKKGTEFSVETFDVGQRYGDGPSGIMATTIALAQRPFGHVITDHKEGTQFGLLLPHLEEATKTVNTILMASGESHGTTICTSLFKWMVKEGRMTIEEFEAVYREFLLRSLDDE